MPPAPAVSPTSKAESDLEDLVAECYDDPLNFVRMMYPWGEAGGPLERESGPDTWQVAVLTRIGEATKARAFNGRDAVAPIREAIASGHGIGKSTLSAWLVNWIMSTRPQCRGTVTANTFTQLQTKTWAAVQEWTARCLTRHWFVVNNDRIYHKDHAATWFFALQSSSKDNSESFAGQHAASSSSVYIVDEASGIPDVIFEVAEGGLTDGEPMMFLFGNATQSSGKFYRVVFGDERARWNHTIVDSRESNRTNKAQIAEWIQDFGEDSDFVRVRVRGLPPRASDAQFIDHQRVLDAQTRPVVVLPDEPLVAGVDLAWGGADDNVIRFRCGHDARSIPPIKVKGEFTRDPLVLTTRLADVLSQTYQGKKVAMLFLDSAGIAGPIGNRLRQMGHRNVQDVNFGAESPDPQCRFMRDFMWQRMKEWLIAGAIDKSAELETDLLGPGVLPDSRQRVWLESKKSMKARGLDSPDDADALALTFAAQVRAKPAKASVRPLPPDW
jgi:hypothetical protein